MQGDCQILKTEAPIFAFIREAPQQRLLCMFNLSQDTAHFDLPEDMLPCVTATGANPAAKRNEGMLRLRGYGYFFGNLEPNIHPARSGSAKEQFRQRTHDSNGSPKHSESKEEAETSGHPQESSSSGQESEEGNGHDRSSTASSSAVN